MLVQARDQGRYLGGRPPYGYRLVDAGPHPNRVLARRGVQLRRMDVDPDNTTLGHRDVMRRNTPDEWVISEKQAHPALASEADFVAAQAIRAEKKAVGRTYRLAGLLRCGHCSRLMESCWSNGRAVYRCRHGHSSATPREPNRVPNAYAREDQVLAHLPALHLMRTGDATAPDPAGALARLRDDGIGLIYDHAGRTVTADTERKERIAIGR